MISTIKKLLSAFPSQIFRISPVIFFAAPAMAEQPWQITGMNYPPLVYADETSDFTGTVANTVKALCEASGLSCTYQRLPLKRSMYLVGSGDINATITIDTGKPMPCCTQSAWQTTWSAGFFSHLPSKDVPKTPEDLKGHSLITVLGMKSPYSFAPKLDEMVDRANVTLFKGPNIKAAVDMFMHHRAPLLWGSSDFTWHIEQQYDQPAPAFHTRLSFPMVLWIRKDNPELLTALNNGYQILLSANALDSNGILKSASDATQ